jgi:hypothetical protein
MLGIHPDRPILYEGPAQNGIGIFPAPFVLLATIIRSEEDLEAIPDRTYIGAARLLFREDYFDPVTRSEEGVYTTTMMARSGPQAS